jgi:predicted nuclease of predicted toxin-antitoxin system
MSIQLKREGINRYDDEGDASILEIAKENERVIFTNDTDFERIHEEKDHPGIMFLKTQYADVSRTVAQVVKHTDRMSKEGFEALRSLNSNQSILHNRFQLWS